MTKPYNLEFAEDFCVSECPERMTLEPEERRCKWDQYCEVQWPDNFDPANPEANTE